MAIIEEKTDLNQISNLNKFKIESGNFKAFMALSDNLYSNKKLAILRELISNAIDATIISDNQDKFIHVNIPEVFIDGQDNILSVQDFGTGITIEDFFNIYCVYMNSSKNDDSSQNGGFGIGGKTPFTYTNNFKIETTDPNTKIRHSFNIYYDKDFIPSINYNEDNDIQNSEIKGTKVSFVIKNEKDLKGFLDIYNSDLFSCTRIPIYFNHTKQSSFNSFMLENFGLSVLRYNHYIRCGDFIYEIDNENFNINNQLEELYKLNNICCFIFYCYYNKANTNDNFGIYSFSKYYVFDSNEEEFISLDLSREYIENTVENSEKIKKIINKKISNLKNNISKFFSDNNVKNIHDFSKKLISFFYLKQLDNAKIYDLNIDFDDVIKNMEIEFNNYNMKISCPNLYLIKNNKAEIKFNINLKDNNIFKDIENIKSCRKINETDLTSYINFINNILSILYSNDEEHSKIKSLFLARRCNIPDLKFEYFLTKFTGLNHFIHVDNIEPYLNGIHNEVIRKYMKINYNNSYIKSKFYFIFQNSEKKNNNIIDAIFEKENNKLNKKLKEKGSNKLKNDFNVAQSMFSKIYKIEDFKTGIENIIKTKLVLPASIDVDNSDKKLNLFSYLFYDKFKSCNINNRVQLKNSLNNSFLNNQIYFLNNDDFNDLVESKLLSSNPIENLKTLIYQKLNEVYFYIKNLEKLNFLSYSDIYNENTIKKEDLNFNIKFDTKEIFKYLEYDLFHFLNLNKEKVILDFKNNFNSFEFDENFIINEVMNENNEIDNEKFKNYYFDNINDSLYLYNIFYFINLISFIDNLDEVDNISDYLEKYNKLKRKLTIYNIKDITYSFRDKFLFQRSDSYCRYRYNYESILTPDYFKEYKCILFSDSDLINYYLSRTKYLNMDI